MIICLVRHGQTDWNNQGLIQGQTDNVLNKTGKLQAQRVGKYLKDNNQHWDLIISSPLKRAIETAEIIAQTIGYTKDIIINPKVIERNFGELEAHVLDAVTYDKIFEENVRGLELKADLQARAIDALLEIAQAYPNQQILVFSHAQFIKSLISAIDPSFNFRSLLKNSSMNFFEVIDNQIKILRYNVVSDPE